ncbi:glycoside hydrolase family 18 protein [Flavitalea sp.]|nr:glycoside hydrolase family 18 protein [Flavitalea sp.]
MALLKKKAAAGFRFEKLELVLNAESLSVQSIIFNPLMVVSASFSRITSLRGSVLFLFCFVSFVLISMRPAPVKAKKVVIGYVGGYRGLVNAAAIDAAKLSIINYAFVDVKGNRAWLTNQLTDTTNFRLLNELKKVNPNLQIVISIGGWAWSENFSDAVLTDTGRQAFAKSAVEIISNYQLDGVDIDWEYPAIPGEEGNIFRPEDKQNFTLMFRDLRIQLDSLSKINNRKYLLTTAVGGFPRFAENTEMNNAHQYLDYISLMTYDFSGKETVGHHTNLFPSADFEKENSVDKAVKVFMNAGVPAEKLVVGLAFYGRSWILSGSEKPVMQNKIVSSTRGGGYTYLKDSLVDQRGFKAYWDKKAKAPYLFNDSTRQFISYDNERSVKNKIKYVKKHKLGGVMFWEYSSDLKKYLLNTIDENLKHK